MVPPSTIAWTPSMYGAEPPGCRLPLCEQAVAPTGRMQYCTKLVAPPTSLLSFHAISAAPVLSTATEGESLDSGDPTVTTLPAAIALAHSASADRPATAQLSAILRHADPRPNARHIRLPP